MKTYIHYGHNVFDPDAMRISMKEAVMYRRIDKPHGLWASPVDAKYGWKDWCECEEYDLEKLASHFTFSLKTCRILHVRRLEDIKNYITEDPLYKRLIYPQYALDLGKIYKYFDAMELHLSDNWPLRDCNIFYTWDVDSIVIWNPDIIIPVDSKELIAS